MARKKKVFLYMYLYMDVCHIVESAQCLQHMFLHQNEDDYKFYVSVEILRHMSVCIQSRVSNLPTHHQLGFEVVLKQVQYYKKICFTDSANIT